VISRRNLKRLVRGQSMLEVLLLVVGLVLILGLGSGPLSSLVQAIVSHDGRWSHALSMP